MTVFNILDQRRANEYNTHVDVVYEVFNGDAGVLPEATEEYTEWQSQTTVQKAISIAQGLVGSVTVFLYDPGWVIDNYGFIVVIHPKLKRDVLVVHQMSLDLYHGDND